MTTMPQAAAQEQEWTLDDQPQEGADQQAIPPEKANTTAPDADDEPSPYDDLAKEMGWKPKSEWKGPQQGWTPADEYIRTTFAKQREGQERNKALSRQATQAQRAADEYALRLERLERTTNSMMAEQEARFRAELRNNFELAKRDAIKAGDEATYQKLLDQEEQAQQQVAQRFKREPEPDVQQMAQQMLADPIVGRFWKDHPWVAEDEDAYAYAYAVAQDAADAGQPKSVQIKLVKEALKDAYPDRFQGYTNEGAAPQPGRVRDPSTGQFVPQRDAMLYQQNQPRRTPPNYAQASNGVRAATPEAKAKASLPPEAVRTFEEQKAAGRFRGSIVDYANIYNNANGGKVNVS